MKYVLTLQEQINDIYGIASSYIGLGNIHFYQNRLDEALLAYEEAMQIGKELNDLRLISLCNDNIAGILKLKNKDKIPSNLITKYEYPSIPFAKINNPNEEISNYYTAICSGVVSYQGEKSMLTGSKRTGNAIASQVVEHGERLRLRLGGGNPRIVLLPSTRPPA